MTGKHEEEEEDSGGGGVGTAGKNGDWVNGAAFAVGGRFAVSIAKKAGD